MGTQSSHYYYVIHYIFSADKNRDLISRTESKADIRHNMQTVAWVQSRVYVCHARNGVFYSPIVEGFIGCQSASQSEHQT